MEGISISFTPLTGARGADPSAPSSYLLEIDDFVFLLDCGWTERFDEAQLERLAEGGSLSVRVAVACHENTSEELLVRLAYSVDMEVRFAVCSRTDLDADLLERIQAESRRFADEYQRLDEALEQFDFPFCVDREAVTDESLLAIMDLPPVLAGTDTREIKCNAGRLHSGTNRIDNVRQIF